MNGNTVTTESLQRSEPVVSQVHGHADDAVVIVTDAAGGPLHRGKFEECRAEAARLCRQQPGRRFGVYVLAREFTAS